ncbi:MAG: hypothetical protein P1U58_09800 [Verrucomicrobiales bacterium]|nr:hypothetical protein [Verrucomicrobiales bacterium]
MTKLLEAIVTEALRSSESWDVARNQLAAASATDNEDQLSADQ